MNPKVKNERQRHFFGSRTSRRQAAAPESPNRTAWTIPINLLRQRCGPDSVYATRSLASSSQLRARLLTQMCILHSSMSWLTVRYRRPWGLTLSWYHCQLFPQESTLNSLVFLADDSSKTSFKTEDLVCMDGSNLKFKCYITRVDFESLISKTFQHFPFYKSSSKIIRNVSNVPGIRLGILHLLSHLILKTSLSQAATLISQTVKLKHKEVTHLDPVYTAESGQDSDLSRIPTCLLLYKQQGKEALWSPKSVIPALQFTD